MFTNDYAPRCFWTVDAPLPDAWAPSLPAAADIVVIGGGYTGLTAARETALAGRSTLVVDAAEIGYTWIAPAWQRTAVNTEAKLLMLRHAFETWRCFRVTLKTDERNTRSRRAIERLGAHFDGILRAFQPAVDGKPRNTAYYTILASEWPSVEAALRKKLG